MVMRIVTQLLPRGTEVSSLRPSSVADGLAYRGAVGWYAKLLFSEEEEDMVSAHDDAAILIPFSV